MINTAFTIVFVILCASSLWLWWIVFRRLTAGKEIVPKQYRNPSTLGLIDIAIMFATWAMGMMVFGSLAATLASPAAEAEKLNAEQQAVIIGLVSLGQLVGTGFGLAILMFRHRSYDGLWVSRAKIAEGLGLGILGFGLVVPPILILQLGLSKLVPYQHATFDVLNSDSRLISFLLTWMAAVLIAPICEEIFFRGVLQNWLQRLFAKNKPSLDSLIAGGIDGIDQAALPNAKKINKISGAGSAENADSDLDFAIDSASNSTTRSTQDSASFPLTAVVVTSLIFGMVHLGQGLAPIPLFFFGLALGYLYYQTGNLISCIVLHVALNAFSMFWFTVQVVGEGASGTG